MAIYLKFNLHTLKTNRVVSKQHVEDLMETKVLCRFQLGHWLVA